MTTIAISDGLIAADSLVCRNYTVFGATRKIRAVDSSVYGSGFAAACGRLQDLEVFCGWLKDCGEKPKLDEGFEGVFLTSHNLLQMDDGLVPYVVSGPFFALGSGADFALGAMGAGAGPKEAVDIACRFDAASGGEVSVFDVGEVDRALGKGLAK